MTINLSDVVGITLNGSSVVKIEDTLGNILWEKNNNAEEYFYIENLTSSANTLSIKKNLSDAPSITIYRSTDKTTWTSMGSTSTTALTYSIPANSKVYLKATTNSWCTSPYYNTIKCSGNFSVGGNIMSLLYGDNFIGKTVFPSSSTYNFHKVFYDSTYLKNIDNLILPATTLASYCYSYMFNGCTGLTSIPSNLLPATTLTSYCYSYMFSNCSGLTSIPSNLLPATTLTDYCYQYMFSSCTGLTKSPELPATTLAVRCYSSMFKNCSRLNEITCYANDISATNCTKDWVNGVSSSGTFYKKGSASWTLNSVDGIPTGWTVIESIDPINDYFYVENLTSNANTLSIKKSNASAPTITVYYSTDKTTWTSMGDTDTTEITYSIPANSKVYLKATADRWCGESGNTIYNSITCSDNYAVGGNIMSLLYGDNFIGKTVFPSSSTHNFTRLFFGSSTYLKNINNLVLPATTLTNNCYQNMFQGCSGLTTIPSNLLPATTLANNCYSNMFNGCRGLTKSPELPATTLVSQCYYSMFYGCTSLTKSPELPATTLVSQCYYSMFKNCSSLNEITCYANDISANNCTKDWVNGVAATGTFYKKGSAEWTLDSVNGVPTGWTVKTEYPENTYFYVENLTNSANTLTIKKSSSSQSQVLVYYSTDQTNWTSMGNTTINGITYSIPANSKVYLKANTTKWGQTQYGYTCISAADDFAVGGNIMSLLYGDNFRGQTTIPTPTDSDGGPAAFYGLFHGALKLKSINNLVLPATTLTEYCYHMMFDRCKGLTSIPSNLLPATTLQRNCYGSMFSWCTGLTTIPSTLLHSTTLANGCYNGMFSGCSGLTSIPSNLLPATTLATDCYTFMFDNCTGLTTIPSTLLHSTTLASHCYYGMFRSCTGLTTIPSNLLPATTLTEYCYNSMFTGCTGLTSTPILPATTLAQACYAGMFYNCSSLNKVICYANHISATDCTSQWLSGVSRYGTFYKLGSADWEVGGSGVPTGWTVETEYSE